MTQQEAMEAAAAVREKLVTASKAKKEAVQTVISKLDTFKNATKVGHTLDANDARVLEDVLNALVTILKVQDLFMEQQARDQYGMAQELNNLNHNTFMTAATVETVKSVLVEKGQLTDEDMKAHWARVMQTADTAAVPDEPSNVIQLPTNKG